MPDPQIVSDAEIVRGMRCPICQKEALVVRLGGGRHSDRLACVAGGCTYVYDLKTKINVN